MFGNWNSFTQWNNGWLDGPGWRMGLNLLLLWGLLWKGLALWRAAKEDSKPWYLALLILQTGGLLEIAYLFFFAKEKLTLSSTPKKKSKK